MDIQLEKATNIKNNVAVLEGLAAKMKEVDKLNQSIENIELVLVHQQPLLDVVEDFVKNKYFPPEACVLINYLDVMFESLRKSLVLENPNLR